MLFSNINQRTIGKKAVFVLALMIMMSLLSPIALLAQSPIVPCDGGTDDSTKCDFYDLVEMGRRLVNWLIIMSTAVAAIAFSYAGFLYMTSAGGANVQKAHKIFTNVAVGFMIVLGAWLIVYTFTSAILSDETPPQDFLGDP